MNNLVQGKKAWFLIGGTILLVLAFIFLNYLEKKNSKLRPLEVDTAQLGKATIPAGLPVDLPIEQGSKVLQNYESRTNDGRLQSTRQISTTKDAKVALDLYVAFFKEAGWKGGVSESLSTSGGSQIGLMESSTGKLMIVTTPSGANSSTVELTLTQKQ